jgi:hypothetical protein
MKRSQSSQLNMEPLRLEHNVMLVEYFLYCQESRLYIRMFQYKKGSEKSLVYLLQWDRSFEDQNDVAGSCYDLEGVDSEVYLRSTSITTFKSAEAGDRCNTRLS